MKLEDVLDAWDKDSDIDLTNLPEEQRRFSKCSSKWLRVRSFERLKLAKLYTELKELKLQKQEFYVQGPTKETQDMGWKMPARGAVLKTDVPMYMDADPQIVEMTLKIAYQKEIVEAVETIVNDLAWKHNQLKNIIESFRLTMGPG